MLVDEYQDTNPIQEAIYFQLAARAPHNLVVVGDDDQAMYRFRGGSVECMVTFDDACHAYLALPKTAVAQFDLTDNFRSHPDIVEFFDDYIRAFPVMGMPGARSPKPSITARKSIAQAYPPSACLRVRRCEAVADRFAQMVRELVDTGVVNDPSECCLLLKSTKESPMNAGKYVAALRALGLDVYNPRNKAFTEQDEVQGLLGACSRSSTRLGATRWTRQTATPFRLQNPTCAPLTIGSPRHTRRCGRMWTRHQGHSSQTRSGA